jgi:hypothetical protein
VAQKVAEVVERSLESGLTPGEQRTIGRRTTTRFEGGEYEVSVQIKIERV